MEPVYFETAEGFHDWLEKNHDKETEFVLGYYKKGSGKPSLSYKESVDEGLIFGWIDGVVRSIDAERYSHRFTPRKKGSTWSAVNVKRMGELIEADRVHPAGLKAFEGRDQAKTVLYAHEQDKAELSEEHEAAIKANPKAWAYWLTMTPSYRKAAAWWLISAKKDETKVKRLASLIEHCEREERLPQFISPPGKK